MSKPKTTKPCKTCKGTGQVIDPVKVCPILWRNRRAAGITLKELSDEIGVALPTIDAREHAKSKRPVTQKFIAMHAKGIARILNKRKAKL